MGLPIVGELNGVGCIGIILQPDRILPVMVHRTIRMICCHVASDESIDAGSAGSTHTLAVGGHRF